MRTCAEEVKARGAQLTVITDNPRMAEGLDPNPIIIPNNVREATGDGRGGGTSSEWRSGMKESQSCDDLGCSAPGAFFRAACSSKESYKFFPPLAHFVSIPNWKIQTHFCVVTTASAHSHPYPVCPLVPNNTYVRER